LRKSENKTAARKLAPHALGLLPLALQLHLLDLFEQVDIL
jgi:hypothetical protein